MGRWVKVVTSLALFLLSCSASFAADYRWNAGANGNWNVGANWYELPAGPTGTVPGGGDTAIIDTNFQVTVTAPASVGTLNMSTGSLAGTTNFQVNDDLIVTGGTVADGLNIIMQAALGSTGQINTVDALGNITIDQFAVDAVELTNDLIVNGTLDINAGTLQTNNNSLTVNGGAVVDGTLNASAQTTASLSMTGNLSGSGTCTAGSGTVDVNGNVTVTNLTASSGTTYIGGNYNVTTLNHNGGLIVFDNTNGSTIIGEVFNNVQISANKTMTGAWTCATLTIDAGDTLTTGNNSLSVATLNCNGTLNTGTQPLNVTGNVTDSGAGTINAGSGNVDIGGDITLNTYSASSGTTFVGGNYDVNTLTHNSGTFDFDTNDARTIAANGQTFYLVYISRNRSLTEPMICATLSIDDGRSLDTGNNALTVSGDAQDTGSTGTIALGTAAFNVGGSLTINTVKVPRARSMSTQR